MQCNKLALVAQPPASSTRGETSGPSGPGSGSEHPVFTFQTTHHALWAEETALEAGIPVEVIPAPAAARARCHLALATLPEELAALQALLRDTGVPFALHP